MHVVLQSTYSAYCSDFGMWRLWGDFYSILLVNLLPNSWYVAGMHWGSMTYSEFNIFSSSHLSELKPLTSSSSMRSKGSERLKLKSFSRGVRVVGSPSNCARLPLALCRQAAPWSRLCYDTSLPRWGGGGIVGFVLFLPLKIFLPLAALEIWIVRGLGIFLNYLWEHNYVSFFKTLISQESSKV